MKIEIGRRQPKSEPKPTPLEVEDGVHIQILMKKPIKMAALKNLFSATPWGLN